MDSSSREHRREQLRQAQRRSRQRRQEAIDRLTEENRELSIELDRLRSSISELVDIAWDRWTTGEISNELLGRLIALNQAGSSGTNSGQGSAGEAAQWPGGDPNVTPGDFLSFSTPASVSQSQGSVSTAERMDSPFTETPMTSVFEDNYTPYSYTPTRDQG